MTKFNYMNIHVTFFFYTFADNTQQQNYTHIEQCHPRKSILAPPQLDLLQNKSKFPSSFHFCYLLLLVTEQANEKCIEIAVIRYYLQPKTIQSNESISNKIPVRPNAFGKMNPCLNILKSTLFGAYSDISY